MATYSAQYEKLPFEVTHALIGNAVDYVVYIEKNRKFGGKRCVTTVYEVSGFADGRVTGGFLFKPSPIDGRAVRTPTTITDARRLDLEDAGYNDSAAAWALVDDDAWHVQD